MYYYINSTLTETNELDLKKKHCPYVAVLTCEEWAECRELFEMGIEMDIPSAINSTKAEVNYDSLTGTFLIPDRKNISGSKTAFSFALDEKGIVFVDDSGYVQNAIENIMRSKKWTKPGLERFMYDFLEQIVVKDQQLLEDFDKQLDTIESGILEGSEESPYKQLSAVRSDLRDMRVHYEQLLDLGQEFEENENNFFRKENLRYFHLFTQRIERLHDITNSLRDYTMQIREMFQSQLAEKQNRIMTLLTVITSIFMPLSLIAGWYGMNFRYMPELESRIGYPAVWGVSIAIVIVSLIFFKKKKWL